MTRTLLLVALAACARDPFDDLPVRQSKVVTFDVPQRRPHELDLLFVIDDSPMMAGFRADLATNAKNFISVLATIPGGLPDLHLAVTTSNLGDVDCPGEDGALHRASVVGGDFIAVTPFYDGSTETNFVGSLGDAFAALANVGAAGCARSQPLAAAVRALRSHPSFVRDSADLAIVFITANDDASPGEVVDYAAWLRSAKPDLATEIIVAGIAGSEGSCSFDGGVAIDASRLRSFLDGFPNRSTFTTICQRDLSDGLVLYAELLGSGFWSETCLDAAIDPDRCVLSDRVAGVDVATIPQCRDASGALPCFRFDRSRSAQQTCGDWLPQVLVRIDRHAFAPRSDHVYGQCEVE